MRSRGKRDDAPPRWGRGSPSAESVVDLIYRDESGRSRPERRRTVCVVMMGVCRTNQRRAQSETGRPWPLSGGEGSRRQRTWKRGPLSCWAEAPGAREIGFVYSRTVTPRDGYVTGRTAHRALQMRYHSRAGPQLSGAHGSTVGHAFSPVQTGPASQTKISGAVSHRSQLRPGREEQRVAVWWGPRRLPRVAVAAAGGGGEMVEVVKGGGREATVVRMRFAPLATAPLKERGKGRWRRSTLSDGPAPALTR